MGLTSGAAEDVAEGAEVTTTVMTASTKAVQIKTAGKAITLTDKAVNSGLGGPCRSELLINYLCLMADKIDKRYVGKALATTTLTATSTKAISYEGVVSAVDKLNEEGNTEKSIVCSS